MAAFNERIAAQNLRFEYQTGQSKDDAEIKRIVSIPQFIIVSVCFRWNFTDKRRISQKHFRNFQQSLLHQWRRRFGSIECFCLILNLIPVSLYRFVSVRELTRLMQSDGVHLSERVKINGRDQWLIGELLRRFPAIWELDEGRRGEMEANKRCKSLEGQDSSRKVSGPSSSQCPSPLALTDQFKSNTQALQRTFIVHSAELMRSARQKQLVIDFEMGIHRSQPAISHGDNVISTTKLHRWKICVSIDLIELTIKNISSKIK